VKKKFSLKLDKELNLETGCRVLPSNWIKKSSTLRLGEEFYLETG